MNRRQRWGLWWRRCLAGLYDCLLLLAVWIVVTLAFLMAHGGKAIASGEALYPWYVASLWGCAGAFFIFFWSRAGETLGMRAWGLRVVANNDKPPSPGCASRRLLAMLLGLGLGGAGILWGLVDRQGAMAHDRLAGTRVVRLSRKHPDRKRRA